METDNELSAQVGNILNWIDRTILIIFSIEIVLKFYAYRPSFSAQVGISLIYLSLQSLDTNKWCAIGPGNFEIVRVCG